MITKFLDFLQRVDNDFPTPLSARVNLEEYARKLTDHGFVSVTIKQGVIVGMVAMYCNDTENSYAYIPLVAVDSQYRGQKISKSLMDCAIAYARLNGFKTLGLHTENPVALRLYESLGFVVIEDGHRKYLELDLLKPIVI